MALTGVVGVSQFGYALRYDRYLLLFLGLSSLFIYSQDKNIFTLFALLTLEQLVEEGVWLYSETDLYLRVPMYLWGLFGCYLARDMMIGRLGASAILLILFAECFWWMSGISSTPDLGWSAFIIGQVLILHEAAFMRPHLLNRYLPKWKGVKFFVADGYVMDICKARVVLEFLNVLEFLVRNVFSMHDLLIVYTLYPYLAQSLTVLLIVVVFQETSKSIKSKLFAA